MKIPSEAIILSTGGNRNEASRAARELARIGVDAKIFWNVANPLHRFIPDTMLSSDFLRKPCHMSCNLGHYHIVQVAVDLGLDSLWVVEDDVRFLKDAAKVKAELAAAPEDANFLILDGSQNSRYAERLDRSVHGWHDVGTRLDVRSVANYIVDAKAMSLYARYLCGELTGRLPVAPDVGRDNATFPSLRIYTAYPLLSIQYASPDSPRASAPNDAWVPIYRKLGLAIEDYNT